MSFVHSESEIIIYSGKKLNGLYLVIWQAYNRKYLIFLNCDAENIKSSHPEVFLREGVLKKCSKFTGDHPCWSAICKQWAHRCMMVSKNWSLFLGFGVLDKPCFESYHRRSITRWCHCHLSISQLSKNSEGENQIRTEQNRRLNAYKTGYMIMLIKLVFRQSNIVWTGTLSFLKVKANSIAIF